MDEFVSSAKAKTTLIEMFKRWLCISAPGALGRRRRPNGIGCEKKRLSI